MGSVLKNEVPIFNRQLVNKFTPLINKMISTKVHNYNSSDVCFEREDVFQECLIHLYIATKKYDSKRGMKFSSYVHLVMESRLANFRSKVERKNKKGTINVSALSWHSRNGSEDLGFQLNEAELTLLTKNYHGLKSKLEESNDHLNQILEIQRIYDKLEGIQKILFYERYFQGRSIKEIHQVYPHFKYHTIRRQLKFLKTIINTLVK